MTTNNLTKTQITLLATSVIIVSMVLGGGIFATYSYYSNNKNFNKQFSSLTSTPIATNSSSINSPISSITTASKIKMQGKYEILNEDLGLFSDIDSKVGEKNKHKYVKAGKFLSGKYVGYDRILAQYVFDGMTGNNNQRHILATNDYKSYILESTLAISESFNKQKITSIETDLGSNLSQTIDLQNNFSLHKKEYQDGSIQGILSKLVLIKKIGNISIFENNFDAAENNFDVTNSQSVGTELGYKSELYVSDETGLMSSYAIGFTKYAQEYPTKIKEYKTESDIVQTKQDQWYKYRDIEIEKLKQQGCVDDASADSCFNKGYQNTEKNFGKQPEYPEYVNEPTLQFKKSEIASATVDKLANEYGQFLIGVCGQANTPFVGKNIQESDLQKIGLVNGVEVYTSKKDSEYTKKLYDSKFAFIKTDEDRKNYELSTKQKAPTLEEYFKTYSSLILKDGLGRWIIVGEYQYKIVGGCGKPVMYFYPQKETKVDVKFNTKMDLTVDIPRYSEQSGWSVLAKPNGELLDLQPKLTDCNKFSSNRVGQEYAKESCENNSYPYIYWAGNTSKEYPNIQTGFVATKGELGQKLREKLTFIGLNKKETDDMLEYWLPQMLSKNSNYYRFSLLQNNELDKLFPLQIFPKPDSTIRVFLDWDYANDKIQINEQNLIQYKRGNFAMVEWGGQKK